jgi:hypothetical protein
MAALGWAYVFLFVAQGFVQNVWTFPSLEGFGATFLVSLGTLIAAQTTSSMKGAKGAGEVHPALTDLFVHGGVIALERVQQVLWTMITVGMFVYIVFKNYAETTTFPAIPDELLILMGISALGYVGGKVARKAGPIIQRVDAVAPQGGSGAGAATVGLKITGAALSRNAQVSVDGTPVSGVVVLSPPNGEFATALQVPWTPPSTSVGPAIDGWYAIPRRIVVVNADSQRAEFETPAMLGSASTKSVSGHIEITVEARHVPDGAEWTATGATFTSAQRTTVPYVWLIQLQQAQGQSSGTLSVRFGDQALTCNWQL